MILHIFIFHPVEKEEIEEKEDIRNRKRSASETSLKSAEDPRKCHSITFFNANAFFISFLLQQSRQLWAKP